MRSLSALADFAGSELAPFSTRIARRDPRTKTLCAMLFPSAFQCRVIRRHQRMARNFRNDGHRAISCHVSGPIGQTTYRSLRIPQFLGHAPCQRICRGAKRRHGEFEGQSVPVAGDGHTLPQNAPVLVVQHDKWCNFVPASIDEANQSLVNDRIVLKNKRPAGVRRQEFFVNPSMRQRTSQFRIRDFSLRVAFGRGAVNLGLINQRQPIAPVNRVYKFGGQTQGIQTRPKTVPSGIVRGKRHHINLQPRHQNSIFRSISHRLSDGANTDKHSVDSRFGNAIFATLQKIQGFALKCTKQIAPLIEDPRMNRYHIPEQECWS